MKRRRFLLGVVLLLVCCMADSGFTSGKSFTYEDVVQKASYLAEKEFQPVSTAVPEFLKNIGYDQWRDIRFNNSKTLWGRDRVPFKIRFFHLGFLYNQKVLFHYIDKKGVHPFLFSPELFNYDKNNFKNKIPDDLGFAGFRIHYPINRSHTFDEIAAFLGASYFRAIGKDQRYGVSARALAINTAMATGEEFPFFKEFWVQQPAKNDKYIVVYALIDSPSLSGAYQYIIYPGEKTAMDVRSTLFLRKDIQKIGIAPLTSMFFFGENSKYERKSDFRPEVHDSDGVLILSKTKEWIWRPLVNPDNLLINTFEVNTPYGFGLFQRDRVFDHYQYLEARFDLRPSVWVVPKEDWGKGHVELVQIPSKNEYNDNINVYWAPQKSLKARQKLQFSFRLEWFLPSMSQEFGIPTDTRIAFDPENKGVKFVIDFQGRNINAISGNKAVDADISVLKGYKLKQKQIFKNTQTNGWRLVFEIQPDKDRPLKEVVSQKSQADIRAFLKNDGGSLTETWTYTFSP